MGRPMLFDGSGRLVGEIGRAGRGPGEFHAAMLIAVASPNDSVVVCDINTRKRITYSSSGAFAHEEAITLPKLPYTNPNYTPTPVGLFGDDLVYLMTSTGTPDVSQSRKFHLYRDPASGGKGKVIGGGLPETLDPKFQPAAWLNSARFSMGRKRLYFTDGWTFNVRAFSGSGLDWVAQTSLEHRPATPAELKEFDEIRLRTFFGGDVVKRANVEKKYGKAPIPDYLSSYDDVIEDDAGNVWAGEFRLTDSGIRPWHIFDNTGAWIGDVVPPAGWTIRAVGRDIVVVSRKDDSDLDHLFVHRLTR
jgi:hypothetical protein